MTGKETPDIVKPVPVTEAALMMSGSVPTEARVIDCVAAVLSVTLPKLTLDASIFRIGEGGFSERVKFCETLPAVACNVAVCAVVTAETVTEKLALVALAPTKTVAGTTTAALLLTRLMLRPALGAGAVSVTEQSSVAVPARDEFEQESLLNAGVPVPFGDELVFPG